MRCGSPWRLALSPGPCFAQPRPVSPSSRKPSKIRHLREPPAQPCFAVASREGSFIRPRLVSLGLSLNKTLVGFAGGGLVVSAVVVRVCGRWPLAGGALWSGGARAPRLVAGPRPVLSDCSWGSETPPDAEKPVHTRERMVHGSRVGQRLGFFVSAVHRTRRRIATTSREDCGACSRRNTLPIRQMPSSRGALLAEGRWLWPRSLPRRRQARGDPGALGREQLALVESHGSLRLRHHLLRIARRKGPLRRRILRGHRHRDRDDHPDPHRRLAHNVGRQARLVVVVS